MTITAGAIPAIPTAGAMAIGRGTTIMTGTTATMIATKTGITLTAMATTVAMVATITTGEGATVVIILIGTAVMAATVVAMTGIVRIAAVTTMTAGARTKTEAIEITPGAIAAMITMVDPAENPGKPRRATKSATRVTMAATRAGAPETTRNRRRRPATGRRRARR